MRDRSLLLVVLASVVVAGCHAAADRRRRGVHSKEKVPETMPAVGTADANRVVQGEKIELGWGDEIPAHDAVYTWTSEGGLHLYWNGIEVSEDGILDKFERAPSGTRILLWPAYMHLITDWRDYSI